MNIEVIEWIDSCSLSGWSSEKSYRSHADETLLCRSAGFVFHETDDRIGIIQSQTDKAAPDTSFDHSMIIPKVAIVSRRILQMVEGDPTKGAA